MMISLNLSLNRELNLYIEVERQLTTSADKDIQTAGQAKQAEQHINCNRIQDRFCTYVEA